MLSRYGALKKLFTWVLLQQESLTAAVIKRLKDKVLLRQQRKAARSMQGGAGSKGGAAGPTACCRCLADSCCGLIVSAGSLIPDWRLSDHCCGVMQAGIFGLFYFFDRKVDDWLPGTGLVLKKVVCALFPMFTYILMGTIIGLVEGWDFGESFYWAAMTVTTIGYGDFKPESPGGRGFCIVYCPCAVLVLARTGLQVKNVLQEASLKKISLTKIKAMDRDGNGKITRAEYMAAVLLSMGQATEETIELIEFQFRYLDSKERGKLQVVQCTCSPCAPLTCAMRARHRLP